MVPKRGAPADIPSPTVGRHGPLTATLANAVGAFVSTNIDDLVLVAVLLLAANTGLGRPWHVIAGQYLGFAVLLLISTGAALGLAAIPDRVVGLLGALPLALGLRGLWKYLNSDEELGASTTQLIGPLSVAGLTVAGGGDNISVYSLMFRSLSLGDIVITIAVFLLLLAFWCAFGALLARDKRISSALQKISRWLVPLVFIVIGSAVLIRFEIASW